MASSVFKCCIVKHSLLTITRASPSDSRLSTIAEGSSNERLAVANEPSVPAGRIFERLVDLFCSLRVRTIRKMVVLDPWFPSSALMELRVGFIPLVFKR